MNIFKPVAWLVALGFGSVFLAFELQADDTAKVLQQIQTEGNAYYRTDRKLQNAVYNNTGPVIVNDVYQVLEKNSAATCSHFTAYKIKLIRERLPHLKPLVAVYQVRVNYYRVEPHTVVYVQDGDTLYLLDNLKRFLVKNPEIGEGWGLKIYTLAQAREVYS